jgi:hypothetical protein
MYGVWSKISGVQEFSARKKEPSLHERDNMEQLYTDMKQYNDKFLDTGVSVLLLLTRDNPVLAASTRLRAGY